MHREHMFSILNTLGGEGSSSPLRGKFIPCGPPANDVDREEFSSTRYLIAVTSLTDYARREARNLWRSDCLYSSGPAAATVLARLRAGRDDKHAMASSPVPSQANSSGTPALQNAGLAPLMPVNTAPVGFDAARELPSGFLEFLTALHTALTPRQQALLARRDYALRNAHAGKLPDYLPPSVATMQPWRIELPAWCADQRNQMTGPADDAELVVKMLNSGAPGVMLDLEDSTANTWPHITQGVTNILAALGGELSYFDRKRDRTVTIKPGNTVISLRPRGLHLRQARVLNGEKMSASLFDVALIAFQL